MWWKREPPVLDSEMLTGIINKLMAMDEKLDEILEHVRDDDEED
ncbi:MAG TPA: hypothetical protein VGJ77_11835 [Gaiellaceae bacterium]